VKRYILATALLTALGLSIEIGCSGPGAGSRVPITAAPATVAIFGGDTPYCGAISFTLTVTGLTLTPQSGSSPVSILPSGTALTVDFASLMDFATMLSRASVPAGIYSSLGITLSNPQLTYLDTSTTPPTFKTIAPFMSSLNVNLDFTPALTIASGSTLALELDFNLLNSLTAGANNEFTVTPTFSAGQAAASGSGDFAQFDDLSGLVQSVSTSSSNPAYAGSFTLSSPNAQTFTVYTNNSTSFAGVSGLGSLTAGTFVEMSAVLDSSANIVANNVVAEAQENAASGEAAFSGLIASVTRQSGNAAQFSLLVQQESPSVTSTVAQLSLLTVDVDSATSFGVADPAADFAGFAFGPASLAVGQRVVVHGTLPGNSGTAQSATARSIFLGLQSVLGNLSTNPATPVTVASDGVDGGFTLVPCSPLFGSGPITVLAGQQTGYVGLANLGSLNNQGGHFLLVKGLLFYQPTTTTYGVESWTVPADVQVAAEVHQIP